MTSGKYPYSLKWKLIVIWNLLMVWFFIFIHTTLCNFKEFKHMSVLILDEWKLAFLYFQVLSEIG